MFSYAGLSPCQRSLHEGSSQDMVTSGFNTVCARGGSGEYSFAPVSLLICFCAAWPSLGKVSPLKAGKWAQANSVGKKKRRSISRPGFQAEIAEKSTALVRSHHIIPNPRFSEIFHMGSAWLRAFMSCAFHLLIAKNGNGSQKRSSDQRPSPFNSIQRQLI